MEAVRTADEIRDVNTRYHDVAASSYDSKWGIDFGQVGQAQVLGKLRKVLGAALEGGFARSLEVGAGTGYFSLNLLRAGIVAEAICTDISPGMVRTLRANAERLGLEQVVDIHAFVPDDLARLARAAGFADIRVRGEELLANWFGWFNRGLESTAEPIDVPMLWRQYAFHGYLLLQRVDERLLEPRLPPAIF